MARVYPHAVVIGGSVAGLVAARVLADHADRVTIIERDALPASVTPRKGTPQARHNHVLLVKGRQICERLFPGLDAELEAGGAPELFVGRTIGYLSPAGWGAPFEPALSIRSFTRDFFEATLRRRVLALPQVEVRHGTVSRLVLRAGVVAGVAIGDDELPATLVVDASGRGSRTPRWLEEAGLQRPPETVVDAGVRYASRLYRNVHLPDGMKGLYFTSTPRTPGAMLYPVENGFTMLSVTGSGDSRPPDTDDAYLAFLRRLRSPMIADAIAQAEPASDIAVSGTTRNELRHYDQIRLPSGLVLIGDSVCALNPSYGQGMSVATIAALELQQLLESGADAAALSRDLPARIAAVCQPAWQAATGEDFRYPHCAGERPRGIAVVNKYLDGLYSLLTVDGRTYDAFARVTFFLSPSSTLFSPKLALRIAARALLRRGPARLTPLPPRGAVDAGSTDWRSA